MKNEMEQNIGSTLFKRLLEAFNQGTEQVLLLFNDDAVIEYPYAGALGAPTQLDKQKYQDHLTSILPQMPGIAFSEIRIYPVTDGKSFWAETRGETRIPQTGKKYEQDYVMYFEVENGKFSFYREYWNPQAVLQAFDGSEKAQESSENSSE